MKTRTMDIPALIILVMIGLTAGLLSGLVGIGGGIILVPALIYFLNYNQLQAQGTSLGILTIPVTILAFFIYYNDCSAMKTPIEFKVVGIVAAGFILGSYFGSRIAVKIDQDLLKKIFAVILFYTGIKMLHWDSLIMNWFKNILS